MHGSRQLVRQNVAPAHLRGRCVPSAGALLVRQIKNTIGVSAAVDVVEPAGIERSVGKMRRIVDRRPLR